MNWFREIVSSGRFLIVLGVVHDRVRAWFLFGAKAGAMKRRRGLTRAPRSRPG